MHSLINQWLDADSVIRAERYNAALDMRIRVMRLLTETAEQQADTQAQIALLEAALAVARVPVLEVAA